MFEFELQQFEFVYDECNIPKQKSKRDIWKITGCVAIRKYNPTR